MQQQNAPIKQAPDSFFSVSYTKKRASVTVTSLINVSSNYVKLCISLQLNFPLMSLWVANKTSGTSDENLLSLEKANWKHKMVTKIKVSHAGIKVHL